jgi:hypothetical protein
MSHYRTFFQNIAIVEATKKAIANLTGFVRRSSNGRVIMRLREEPNNGAATSTEKSLNLIPATSRIAISPDHPLFAR